MTSAACVSRLMRHAMQQVPRICIGAFHTMSEALDALKPWILCMHARERRQDHETLDSPLPPLAPFGHCPPAATFPPPWLQFAQECICIAR